jgi:FkbH-like protein
MTLTVGPIDATNRARVTQLINKSNQFNLVTRRLTETEVEALEADPSVITIQAKLSDRFGDMGLISVVTAEIDGTEARVTDWLMSCRVLGRKVEEGIYDSLVNVLAKRGVENIQAAYIPTKKNSMVAEHFDKLGLTRVRETEDGAHHYQASIAEYARPSLPLKIDSTI